MTLVNVEGKSIANCYKEKPKSSEIKLINGMFNAYLMVRLFITKNISI